MLLDGLPIAVLAATVVFDVVAFNGCPCSEIPTTFKK